MPVDGTELAAESVGSLVPVAAGVVSWLVQATISGVLGLLIGALCEPLAHHLIEPAGKWLSARFS